MNKYVKEYLHRGLIFGGFGPIVAGIVLYFVMLSEGGEFFAPADFLIAVISTYILAFVHAGSSVFNQIEGWSLAKTLVFHIGSLYVVYLLTYIVNSWIPFSIVGILVFTGIFAAVYFVVWITVYLIVLASSKKMNSSL